MIRMISAGILLAGTAVFGGSSVGMSLPTQPRCVVINGDKLPAASGGSAALCAAIEKAVSAKVPGAKFSAEIRLVSPSTLSGILTLEGQQLSEQKFARLDRELDGSAFERFADALAEQAAEARR